MPSVYGHLKTNSDIRRMQMVYRDMHELCDEAELFRGGIPAGSDWWWRLNDK